MQLIISLIDFMALDWTSLIAMAVSALGGGGLTGFWLSKTQKQKETIDVQDKVAELSDKYLHIIREQHEELTKEKQEATEREDKLRTENAEMAKRLSKVRNEAETKGYYMCLHQGCVLRRPSSGQGKIYYENHKDEVGFGADFTPVEDLLARHKRQPPQETTLFGKKNEEEDEDGTDTDENV